MRYVRTLKGLSPAHVKLVTKEMARSVEVISKSPRSNVLNHQSVSQADILRKLLCYSTAILEDRHICIGHRFHLEHRVKRIMTRKKFLSFVSSHSERKINCAIYVSLLFSDIDECTSKTHDCDRTALCKNSEGSFSCTCKPGYKRDGKKCKGSTRNYRIVCFYQSNTFVIDS